MKVLVLLLLLIVIFPLVWMAIGSFKNCLLAIGPEILLPHRFTIKNYQELFRETVGLWLCNSGLVCGLATVLSVLINAVTGFAFASYRFKGKEVIFWIFLASMMIPGHVSLIPLYIMIRNFGLYDTRLALVIPFLVSSFFIFFYRRYLYNYPDSFLEAGRLDGAGELRMFFSIVLPTTQPALVTMGILTFMGQWKAYLMPRVLIVNKMKLTLTVGITEAVRRIGAGEQWNLDDTTYRGVVNYGVMMAAGFFTVIPILLLFVFLQKYFIRSIEGGLEN